jgi:hypothetical protein
MLRRSATAPNTNGADKAHWADKVASVDGASRTVRYDVTNGCNEDQSVHYVSFDASAAGKGWRPLARRRPRRSGRDLNPYSGQPTRHKWVENAAIVAIPHGGPHTTGAGFR